MAVVSVRTVQTLAEPEDISMSDMSLKTTSHLPATVRAPPSFTSCPVQSMWHFILFSIFFLIKTINKSHETHETHNIFIVLTAIVHVKKYMTTLFVSVQPTTSSAGGGAWS